MLCVQVTNNAGLSSVPLSVERQVVVAQICLPGEVSCEAGKCVTGAACVWLCVHVSAGMCV